MYQDTYGLPVTSLSHGAVDRYSEAQRLLLVRNGGAREALVEAIAFDDGLALAHIALAVLHQQAGRTPEARTEAEAAARLAKGISRREQSHVALFATAVEGDANKAFDLSLEHLKEFPRDALVLRQLHMLLNASGRSDRKEAHYAVVCDLAPSYGEDAWFLAANSFVHTEIYQFVEGRRLAERSYALDPRSCDCAHSMAHVLLETGDHDGGSSFLGTWLDGSDWQRGYDGHLYWHLALFELALQRSAQSLSLYGSRIAPDKHPGGLRPALSDAASLVWRWRLYGLDPPSDVTEKLRAFAVERFPRAGQSFQDLHKTMALALAGDFESLDALHDEVQGLVEAGKMAVGPVMPAIVRGLGQFAQGRYDEAAETLEPHRDDFVRVGGSRAQYEVLWDTLLVAYLRSGRAGRAFPLLKARLQRRPSPRDEEWLRAGAGAFQQ